MPEAFRNACQTDPTFKGGPKPRRGLLDLTQERISRAMHLLIKVDNHRWILEITVTQMIVTNSQVTQPPCMGLRSKTLGQNQEKGGKVGPHCPDKQAELDMGDKSKVIVVFGFVKA